MNELRTQRLILRPFTDADLDHLVELDRDPEVIRYAEPGLEATPENRRPFLARYVAAPGRHWAAEEDGVFVGWFFLRDGELGYRLKRSAWGRGLATEGARAVLTLADGPVHADVVAANTGSINVLAKLGFRVVNEGEWHGLPDLHFERPCA